MKTKYSFDNLVTIFQNYEDAFWSPTRMNMHFGCNCGCGGDNYTAEEWQQAEDNALAAINKMKQFCADMGIEYTGIN